MRNPSGYETKDNLEEINKTRPDQSNPNPVPNKKSK